MTSQQQALIALLGLQGPRGRAQIIDALWDGKPISDSRFANLLAEVRAVVGRDRLVQDSDNRYQLIDVITDVDRFTALAHEADVATADQAPGTGAQNALDLLEQAIGLVEGPVLDGGTRRYWSWLDNGYHRRFGIEQMIVAAALRATALALGEHQPQRARRVCEQALTAVPHDDRLIAALAELHVAQGRRGSAAELVAGWEQAVRRLGLGEPSTGPRNILLGTARGER